jgi:hypothetical protein
MFGEKGSAGRLAPIDAAQRFRCVGIAQGCANHDNADKAAFINRSKAD